AALAAIDARTRVIEGREGEQPLAGRQMRGPAGVLHERRASRGKIALGTIAEPSGPGGDVGVFGDAELRLRALNEIAVVPGRPRDAHGVDRAPPMLAKQRLRSVDRELEPLRRSCR